MVSGAMFIANPCLAESKVVDAPTATKEMAKESAMSLDAYVVNYSGAGWSAAKKARAAFKTQDGIKTIMISGLRATVFMEEGKTLEEASISKAITSKGIKFVSMSKETLVAPKAEYVLTITGGGWAVESNKARVALEKMDGVAAAYVDKDVKIHLSDATAFNEEAVKSELKKLKFIATSVKKSEAVSY